MNNLTTDKLLHTLNLAEYHGIISLSERDKQAKQIEKLFKKIQVYNNKISFAKDQEIIDQEKKEFFLG